MDNGKQKVDDDQIAERKPEIKNPTFELDLEGTIHSWPEATISVEQLAVLGGWNVGDGVVEIDKDNVERTLQPGEIIHLKPGHGFAKKRKWKRGLFLPRVQEEFNLLLKHYPDAQIMEEGGQAWIYIPAYPLPENWHLGEMQVQTCRLCCVLGAGYPEGTPYAFLTPPDLRFRGQTPSNTTLAPFKPFGHEWMQFSWSPDEQWMPSAEIEKGSNLVRWVASFRQRFMEGL